MKTFSWKLRLDRKVSKNISFRGKMLQGKKKVRIFIITPKYQKKGFQCFNLLVFVYRPLVTIARICDSSNVWRLSHSSPSYLAKCYHTTSVSVSPRLPPNLSLSKYRFTFSIWWCVPILFCNCGNMIQIGILTEMKITFGSFGGLIHSCRVQ